MPSEKRLRRRTSLRVNQAIEHHHHTGSWDTLNPTLSTWTCGGPRGMLSRTLSRSAIEIFLIHVKGSFRQAGRLRTQEACRPQRFKAFDGWIRILDNVAASLVGYR